MNKNYTRALQQLDELINHIRSNSKVSCSIAEKEDQILIKLSDLKIDLKPNDEKAIADIDRYYQRTFGHE